MVLYTRVPRLAILLGHTCLIFYRGKEKKVNTEKQVAFIRVQFYKLKCVAVER
jgi:hypothetical protein